MSDDKPKLEEYKEKTEPPKQDAPDLDKVENWFSTDKLPIPSHVGPLTEALQKIIDSKDSKTPITESTPEGGKCEPNASGLKSYDCVNQENSSPKR